MSCLEGVKGAVRTPEGSPGGPLEQVAFTRVPAIKVSPIPIETRPAVAGIPVVACEGDYFPRFCICKLQEDPFSHPQVIS